MLRHGFIVDGHFFSDVLSASAKTRSATWSPLFATGQPP